MVLHKFLANPAYATSTLGEEEEEFTSDMMHAWLKKGISMHEHLATLAYPSSFANRLIPHFSLWCKGAER